jgi:hypothetical protein
VTERGVAAERRVAMHYDERPDPEWGRALAVVAPPSERISWLKLVWEPGDVWQPVHRWMVYQMVPRSAVNEMQRGYLEGPNPRTQGGFDRVLGRFMSRAAPISMRQWLLWRETGALGIPYWVVEGDGGGHRYRLDQVEEQVIALHGEGKKLPAPGDLPYAPFDWRALDRLYHLDRIRAYKNCLAFWERSPTALEADERDAREAFRWDLWKWLETQVVDAAVDESGLNWGAVRADAPRGPRMTPKRFEMAQETFITDV